MGFVKLDARSAYDLVRYGDEAILGEAFDGMLRVSR